MASDEYEIGKSMGELFVSMIKFVIWCYVNCTYVIAFGYGFYLGINKFHFQFVASAIMGICIAFILLLFVSFLNRYGQRLQRAKNMIGVLLRVMSISIVCIPPLLVGGILGLNYFSKASMSIVERIIIAVFFGLMLALPAYYWTFTNKPDK